MGRRLLIVDDAAVIRRMIKDVAEMAGWTVIAEAANGQEAIDLYRETRPDAVTLDLVMPQYDGLHALRGMRGLDPEARVLVVSALDQKQVLKQAIQAGAADFVVKPFDKGALRESLERLGPSPATAC